MSDEELLLSMQQQWNDADSEIKAIYKQADETSKQHKEKKKLKEKEADELRNKLFSQNIEYKRADLLTEQMFSWAEKMYWTPYKLWWKNKDWIDCSWLFTAFWESQWLVSEWYKIHVWNAYNLFSKKTAPVNNPKRWDIFFMKPQWWWIDHIWLVYNVAYDFEREMWLTIVDASYDHWVSKRNIVITKTAMTDNTIEHTYAVDWVVYDVYYATNPILSFQRESEITEKLEENKQAKQTIKKEVDIDLTRSIWEEDWFYLSHYNVWDIYQNDDSPCHWATWADICRHLENWWQSIALVRPYREKYWINYRDKVVLEWDETCRWEYTVLDEMNKRFRDRCIVWSNSPYCIRWDIAYPHWVKWSWWNCYIKRIMKAI